MTNETFVEVNGRHLLQHRMQVKHTSVKTQTTQQANYCNIRIRSEKSNCKLIMLFGNKKNLISTQESQGRTFLLGKNC